MTSTTIEESPAHSATKTTSNFAGDSDLRPLYKYEPLPTATSIRLLKLLHSPAGQIHCELHTIDLSDDVKFDALSYTWGNPITVYERPDEEFRASNPYNTDEIIEKSGAAIYLDSGTGIVDHEALDYRYRHPSIPYEKVETKTEKTHNIVCSKSTIAVTENLFGALCVFRRLIMREFGSSLYGHADFEEPPLPTPLSTYIWIDAICINQEDILERNSQVMIMPRIYSLSQNVFCWIGKEDNFSKQGLFMLYHLFGLVHQDSSSQDQWYPTLAQVFKGGGTRDWLALFALFQRLWFRRAWIVQELVFASQLTMICGYDFFTWSMIQSVFQFMRKTRLDKEVSKMAQSLMQKAPLTKEFKALKKAVISTKAADQTHISSTSSKFRFSLNPTSTYALVTGVPFIKLRLGMKYEFLCRVPDAAQRDNARVSSDGQTPDMKFSRYMSRYTLRSSRMIPSGATGGYDWYDETKDEHGNCFITANDPEWDQSWTKFTLTQCSLVPDPQPPISLLSIISIFRMCSASDPRDKIFAFLGLAERGHGGSTLNDNTLKADYGLSVQDVYITATKSMLKTDGLNVLSQVQDPSLTEVSGLPSWVPDFSVDLGRYNYLQDCLSYFIGSGLNFKSPSGVTLSMSHWAASGMQEKASYTVTADNHLVLEGTMIDAISAVASLKGCYFQRIADLALATPAHYLNNQGTHPTFTSYPSDVAEPGRKGLLLRTAEDPDFPSISRVEALWRTITLDSIDGICPAPARCGYGFSNWVGLYLERAQKGWENAQVMEDPEKMKNAQVAEQNRQLCNYFFHRMGEKMACWKALDRDEAGGFYTLEEIQIIKEKKIHSKDDTGNASEIDGHGLRYLPDERRMAQIVKRGVERKEKFHIVVQDHNFTSHEKSCLAAFESRIREVKIGRRMFRTKGGYLGMGSVSVEAGDQVWVVKGGNVPLVLRPKNGRYRLIGEAYVHGIMWGEAVRVGCTFQEVVLE